MSVVGMDWGPCTAFLGQEMSCCPGRRKGRGGVAIINTLRFRKMPNREVFPLCS